MAELLVRVGSGDAALVRRIFDTRTATPRRLLPNRIVTDAHAALTNPDLASVARRAGIPFVVDPQTFYLQGEQHPEDPWSQLSFADAAKLTPADLSSEDRMDRLVAKCLEFQLERGASVLVPPYVHVERGADGWGEVQAALWHRTRRYLDQQDLQLPVLAVLALGWRLLDRNLWPSAFHPLSGALTQLAPTEVALAASKVDRGAHPDHRLVSLLSAIGQMKKTFPVIAWQQGTLGEAAVAAGAAGYETGVGWREHCDLQTAMSQHRKPKNPDGGFSPRPVYIRALGTSIPKRTVAELMSQPRIAPNLVCVEANCCSNGRDDLLRDARQHAITSRAQLLHELAEPAQPAWQWNVLARRSATALEIAEQINRVAAKSDSALKIDTSHLRAINVVAENRRKTLGRRRAA
ncbi:hypothetical protein [Lentzea sp. HUAS12]|uniref:hypothetical protein n=1 Tax=Lentzea sp. HUAS12 TaxID=2951806 RepID=UPI0020A00DE2|nr:hypothetical protein [Lentzea sp. HUAS12]USX56462.1 hypothetical protein ND450_20885 [Lentzea sp. HUAS12]